MNLRTDSTLVNYLTIITSSFDVFEIREAWENLTTLDEEYASSNFPTIARTILNGGIKNVDQTPKLLEFFSHTINDNPFEVNDDLTDTDYGYTDFLKHILIESRNLNLLRHVIKTLMDYRSIYLRDYDSIIKFCEAIVHCLSLCPMPDKPDEVSNFKKTTLTIYGYLLTTIDFCESKSERQNIVIACSDAVCKLIAGTDPNSIPGAALAVIMRLGEPTVIPEVVHSIIARSSDDKQLAQLVTILCKWLTQWLNDHTLFIWIEKFIEGLQNERRIAVLDSVLNSCLKLMLQRLVFPMARIQWMPLVHLMLVHVATSKLFHAILADIEKLFEVLSRDPSQPALDCAQDLVNSVSVLMIRFPDEHAYASLKKKLPFQPQAEKVLALLNSSKWIEDNKVITNNYLNASDNNKRIGLNNLGNTCYLNSVLQALVMTPEFREQILVYDEESIRKNRILHELQRLFALLLYSQRSCLSPTDFLRVSRPRYFTQGQQHDSAEFLCHLLDVLYEEERTTMSQCNSSDETKHDRSPDNATIFHSQRRTNTSGDVNSDLCETNNYTDQSDKKSDMPSIPQLSLVHRVFGGESNTTYQCNQCHTSSHNNDHYWELQLSFPEEICGNRGVTLKDLLNYYLTPEKLTGDNMYHCERCNSLCEAQRIIKILRAPVHLILTLKHFHYDIDSRLKTKLFHKVVYNETIQIPVLKNGHSDSETYQLYAAVVHSGYSMDYGHYFTYARDRTKKWYKFNDSCVHETSLDEFFQLRAPCTPYILFYEKITDNLGDEMRERPVLASLGENIRNVVAMDTAKYRTEQNICVQNRITQLPNDEYYQLSTSLTKRRDNSDDDNPPPTNCRDSVDIQPNRFLY